MGNCCEVQGAVDHWIYIKIGDRKPPLTDAHLRVIVQDIKNRRSPEIRIDCMYKSQFERGGQDIFEAPELIGYDDITEIELWRDGDSGDDLAAADLYIEAIIVNDRYTEKWFYFPVGRWLAPDSTTRYKIAEFDTRIVRPDDPWKEQRDRELTAKREIYQYGQTAPDLPVQVGMLPPVEQFSDEYKHDIINAQLTLMAHRGVMQPSTQPWSSLEEIINSYVPALHTPRSVDSWSSDIHFGAQRLVGCNPLMVKLCTQLPENMGVTAEMLRPFLEGWTLKQIIDAKRLFIVDLKILEKIPRLYNRPLCVPMGLFFVTGDKQFVPIAIQLYQHIAPDNPVFLPSDAQFTWLLAKMWFNNADAAVHQALCHFGYTHLLMESACVSMHRHLSPVHPLFKLLAPHFLFLPAINARGLDQLWAPGGWVDKNCTLGREGMFDLIRRGIDDWRMDIHGSFLKELESRGVLDPKILPNYGFRDDALLLYKAIETYVGKIIRCYYDSLEKITNDTELQNWAKELVTPKEDGGAGFNGVPGNGRFRRVEEIMMVCVSFIFTCSVVHSAVNYPQYNEYGFPPNYPSILNGYPPKDKSPRSEEDLIAALPDISSSLDVMSITRLFSEPVTKGLAEWEFQFQYDPPALRAVREFREELKMISANIVQRNKERDFEVKYTYLLPANIPNAVCI